MHERERREVSDVGNWKMISKKGKDQFFSLLESRISYRIVELQIAIAIILSNFYFIGKETEGQKEKVLYRQINGKIRTRVWVF